MQLLIYTGIQRMNATNSELWLKSPFWKVSAGNNPFLCDLCEQKVMPSTRPAERSRSGPAADLRLAGPLNDGTLRAYNSSTLHRLQLVLLSTVFEFDGYSNNIPSLSCHSGQKELQIKQPATGGWWGRQTPREVDYFPSAGQDRGDEFKASWSYSNWGQSVSTGSYTV